MSPHQKENLLHRYQLLMSALIISEMHLLQCTQSVWMVMYPEELAYTIKYIQSMDERDTK